MKVYVLTKGVYSDYHIEAIFAKRKDAEAAAKRDRAAHNATDDYGQAEVRAWELQEGCPEPVVVHHHSWWGRNDYRSEDEERKTVELKWPWDTYTPTPKMAVSSFFSDDHIHVYGTDEARVDKAFYDRVARAKAVREGIT